MKRPNLASTLSIDNNEEDISPLPAKRRRIRIVDVQWTVTVHEVPKMPYLYLKEKTSVVVLNDSPQLIANRIVESAKAMNCVGEYNSSTAKATLTVDDTEFQIQLFKVTEKTNECIIVEMHRLNGSSIVFHTVARSILSASKRTNEVNANVNVNGNDTRGDNSPRSTMRSPSSGKREGSTSSSSRNEQKESDLFTCTMEIVDSLLKKDRVDANLLGMESLQLLTNPRASSDAMVAYASNVVITGGSGHFMDVKDALMALICNNDATTTMDGERRDDGVEDPYMRKMRLMAFTALSNALEAMASDDSFQQSVMDEEWTRDDGVLASLLAEMNNAKASPQEAHLAAKCLLTVLENSVGMRTIAVELGASSAVLKTQSVGGAYHLLSGVSGGLLQILGETK
jgi:hypothetical protein